MKTPLENIVEWFNALPVSYRQAVAVEVASMMPGMEPNISNPFYHKQFIAKISEPQPDRMKEEGLVVSLKALIEDIITVRTNETENPVEYPVTELVHAQCRAPCKAGLVGDGKESPFRAVHFAADGTDGCKTRGAKQVENKERPGCQKAEMGGKGAPYFLSVFGHFRKTEENSECTDDVFLGDQARDRSD